MKKSNAEKGLEIARRCFYKIPQKFSVKVIMNKKIIKKLIPKWKRRKKVTFCGQLTSNFFLEAGYNMEPILGKKSYWNINTTGQYANAIKSVEKGNLREVTPEQAFYLAVIGRPALCLSPVTMVVNGKPFNHAAVIWPVWWEEYNPEKGPIIAQQGWYSLINKPISHKYAWGENWTNSMVKYFLPDLK